MGNFTLSHNVSNAICILKPLLATFQLSSAISLNLGQSQNSVLGNGLILRVPFTGEIAVAAWVGLNQNAQKVKFDLCYNGPTLKRYSGKKLALKVELFGHNYVCNLT